MPEDQGAVLSHAAPRNYNGCPNHFLRSLYTLGSKVFLEAPKVSYIGRALRDGIRILGEAFR